MRVRRKFNTEIDECKKNNSIIVLHETGGGSIPVRLIKFSLAGGETEMLITNLFDEKLGSEGFKELYFKRWPVETKYDEIKNKLEIENFSGRTLTAIKQDFYATMYLSNFASALYRDAQEEVVEEHREKDNKYEYHVNVNHEIGVLKDKFIAVLIEANDEKRNKLLDIIVARLSSRITPFRPNRSVPRNKTPRKSKFHHNQKSNC
jgi:hypothetical protein